MPLNQVRIIGGTWRGRKIYFPSDANGLLRPTTDRIRETVFNWLAPYVLQASCLDAFAGTGAIGFEALSRGAQYVYFIESNPLLVAALKKNATTLAINSHIDIKLGIFFDLALKIKKQFDIIFLDPPFHQNLIRPSLEQLIRQNLVHNETLIYVEAEKNVLLTLPEPFIWFRHKVTSTLQYGIVKQK